MLIKTDGFYRNGSNSNCNFEYFQLRLFSNVFRQTIIFILSQIKLFLDCDFPEIAIKLDGIEENKKKRASFNITSFLCFLNNDNLKEKSEKEKGQEDKDNEKASEIYCEVQEFGKKN